MRWLLLGLLFTYTLAVAPESIVSHPTPSTCKAWAVYDEARGEAVKGRRAVLDVLEEREKRTGENACQLIRKAHQFSGYKLYAEWYVTEEMLTKYAEAATMHPIVQGCTHFHAKSVSPKWASKMVFCKQVGKHLFFKEK